jgi:hypothetical protein
MGWVLRQESDTGILATFPLEPPGPVVVGRSSACGVRLTDEMVSRRHCALGYRGGAWWIQDLGSRNGTRVNDQKVKRAKLSATDVVTVGKTRLRVRYDSGLPGVFDPDATVTHRPQRDSAKHLDAESAAASGAEKLAGLVGRRYRLAQAIHQGATGTFYRAQDIRSGRTACIKLLARGAVAADANLRRFVRGLVAAAKLRHPNIVQFYRAGESRGLWWVAMEYVDGPSVRELVARFGVGKMLTPAKVLAIARDIASALEVAFEHQVLHRNIRPDHILLTKSGRAKLSNFSLLRGIVLETIQRITSSSESVGDLAFLPPEAAEPGGEIDCRADIYGLGACLYSLLVGRPPFAGVSRVDLIERIRHDEPVPPSRVNLAVPGPLEGVVLKCLAKSPSDRFQTPTELRQELVRVARYRGL